MAPIFKPVDEMLDFDPKGRESLKDQLSRTVSTEDAEASTELSKEVGGRISKTVRGHSWMAKATRNAQIYDPIYVGRTCCPYGAVVVTACEIYCGVNPVIILGTFAIAISLFMLFNPHNVVGRWFSWQTRVVVSINSMFMTVAVMTRDKRTIAAFLFWALFSSTIAWLCNKRWLFAQNMLMNERVRLALTQCADTDGMKRWAECGKREVRTFASEAGLPFDDQVLEIGYLGPWLCGYYNDHVERQDQRKLMDRIRTLKREAGQDAEYIEKLENSIRQMEHEMETNTDAEQLRQARDKLFNSADERKRLQKRVIDLEQRLKDKEKELEELTPDECMKRHVLRLRSITNEEGNPMPLRSIKEELELKGIKISVGKIGEICKEAGDTEKEEE